MQKRTTNPNKFQKIEFLEWFFKNIYVTNEVRWNLRGNHEKQPRCEQYQAIENPVQVPSFVRLCVCVCVLVREESSASREKEVNERFVISTFSWRGGGPLPLSAGAALSAPSRRVRVWRWQIICQRQKMREKVSTPEQEFQKKKQKQNGWPKKYHSNSVGGKKKANNQLPPEKSQYQSVKDTFKTNETNQKLKLDNVGYKQVENLYPTLNHSMNPNSNKNIQ